MPDWFSIAYTMEDAYQNKQRATSPVSHSLFRPFEEEADHFEDDFYFDDHNVVGCC
jgi:hypothetical protein